MVRIFTLYGRIMAYWASRVSSRTKFILTFLIGAAIGLFVLGWSVWPVQWTNGAPVDLQKSYRDFYLRAVAIAYSSNAVTTEDLQKLTIGDKWSVDGVLKEVEALQASSPNKDIYVKLIDALRFMQGQPGGGPAPQATATTAPSAPGGLSSSVLLIVGLVVIIALLVFLAPIIVRRINQATQRQAVGGPVTPAAARARVTGVTTWPGEAEPPLREFMMKYEIGDDRFDLSHAIETANESFLGECGMGISETIGTPNPNKVTAFEVWVFDKNDIRTVTSVLMSEHAYSDPTLKAKLATKGDLVLAEPSAIVTLETATLRVRAKVIEMEYGSGQLPVHSYFNRLHVALAAWAVGDGGITQPGDVLRG
ncbi:MAG TPA: hypothetical protein VIK33_10715 [Anaerolineae bacterium]